MFPLKLDTEGLAELGLGPSDTPGKTIYKHIQELRARSLLKIRPKRFEISPSLNVPKKLIAKIPLMKQLQMSKI